MILLALACAGPAAAVEPFASTTTLVSANGHGVLVFEGDRLKGGWNHGYQQLDATHTSADLLYDSYFGYTNLDGAGAWLNDPSQAVVLDGTGILAATQTAGDLEFVQYAFMPRTYDGWAVVQVTRVRNTSTTTAAPAFQLASLHNWKPGGGETLAGYDHENIVEKGSTTSFWYRAPGADEATCEDVFDTVVNGDRLGGECTGYYSDAVPTFGWNLASLGPGEEAWVGVLTAQEPVPAWALLDAEPREWLTAELEAWADFHARATLPTDLNPDETAVYRQQLALLAMSQVREVGAPFGQIPASFPVAAPDEEFPHTWNIAWVRDGAYASVALARAGYADEAAHALRFLFQEGKAGLYASYLSDTSYGVSVCRLYGDGTEWSDEDDTGPNIELDNWGLFLWALGEAVAAAGDEALLTELGPRALDEVADPLAAMIDPATGLIRADSSIWERHWNGNEKPFTYTSVMAVAGLRAAAELADALGDPRASTYLAHADSVRDAIALHLVAPTDVVAGNLTELQTAGTYLDVAAVEVFNFDVLDPREGPEFAPTLAAWDAELGVAASPGFHRNDDGSAYDEQEWAFADLRIATAMRRACEVDRARELEDWVTDQALHNGQQVPELYDPETGDYEGPTPMLGFGAGLYLLAMQERAQVSAGCPPETVPGDTGDTADTGDTGEPPPDDCGCDASGNAAVGAAVAGLAMLTSRRRRP